MCSKFHATLPSHSAEQLHQGRPKAGISQSSITFNVTVQQNRKHFNKLLCLRHCRLYCLPHLVADGSIDCLIKCTYTCIFSLQSFSWSSLSGVRLWMSWRKGFFFLFLKMYSYCIFLLEYELDQDKDFSSSSLWQIKMHAPYRCSLRLMFLLLS